MRIMITWIAVPPGIPLGLAAREVRYIHEYRSMISKGRMWQTLKSCMQEKRTSHPASLSTYDQIPELGYRLNRGLAEIHGLSPVHLHI